MALRLPKGGGDSTGVYRYAGLGLQFAATLLVFGFGGYWLDGKLGTLPLLLIIGVGLGFGLGTYSLVARLKPLSSKKPPEPRS